MSQMGTLIFLPTRPRPHRRRLRAPLPIRRREEQAVAGDLIALTDFRGRHPRRTALWTPQPPHDGDAA
jgi:hypothetical protein